MTPHSVFISYKRANADWVAAIKQGAGPRLRSSGISLVSDFDLTPGLNWANQVHAMLRDSSCVLALLSEHSHEEHVYDYDVYHSEIKWGMLYGTLLPLALPSLEINSLRFDLRDVQYHLLNSESADEEAVETVLTRIMEMVLGNRQAKHQRRSNARVKYWDNWVKANGFEPLLLAPMGSRAGAWLVLCPLDIETPIPRELFYANSEPLHAIVESASRIEDTDLLLLRLQDVVRLRSAFYEFGSDPSLPLLCELHAMIRMATAFGEAEHFEFLRRESESTRIWCVRHQKVVIANARGQIVEDAPDATSRAHCVFVFDLPA